ncbi:MAG: hypothetical protein SH819_13620 [Cytophagales bacterium]|nr:hypothetical protein [Cytophagales bacterium]
MASRYTFWLWFAAIIQILAAVAHTLSFLQNPVPANATEEQILNLATTYRPELGPLFHPTAGDLFIGLSACFTLFYLLGGLTNIYFLQKKLPPEVLKGLTRIQTFLFGAAFLIMLKFTFWPPITLAGIVFVALCLAYATNHIHLVKLKN